ncbi:MAG: MFS transporter [Micromonosporaceae bacterium]
MRPASRSLTRRLAPLYAAAFLQNLALWVPIEKLFMTSIGFDAASVGVMAAAYAIVVPIFEVPSGVLADRWSRRGVLGLAIVAAILSVIIGGLSQNVATYMVVAVFLGVFFAMQSGTLESIVYDTVLEETGDSDGFERTIGRVRLVESIALVASALLGGLIAEFAPLPVTYFLTAPLLLGACFALIAFKEPRLHQAEEAEPLRRQLRTTYRTILQPGRLRAVVAVTVAGALLMQGMLEFGPLWLVALAVPAFLYGPHWAGLTSALGLGGLLGARPWFARRSAAVVLGVVIVACCVVLAVSRAALVVVAAQVLLTLLVVAVSIPVLRRMHDAVPSSIRASVASGVGTLTWLTFVPFALVMGYVSNRAGISNAGWLLVAIAVATAALIIVVLPAREPAAVPARPPAAALEAAPTFAVDRFLPDDDPQWPGHWSAPPLAWEDAGIRVDSDEALGELRTAIVEMPAEWRSVIVLRDVEGATPAEVQRALGITPEDERARLHQARGLIRTRLERFFEGRTAWPTSPSQPISDAST